MHDDRTSTITHLLVALCVAFVAVGTTMAQGKKLTPDEAAETARVYAECGDAVKASKVLGISPEAVRQRLSKMDAPASGSVVVECEGDKQAINIRSTTIRTLDEALAAAEVDTELWEVERWTANKWDQGSACDGQVSVVELWQVKVWLKRKVSAVEESVLSSILADIGKAAPKYPKIKRRKTKGERFLYEISVLDPHFGKLCSTTTSGESYTLDDARACYLGAVSSLLGRIGNHPVDEIVYVVGSDMLHVDSPTNTTTRGTRQDVSAMWHDAYLAAFEAARVAIEMCREVAPVDVKLVAGNHARQSEFTLAHAMAQRFSGASDVTVDYSPRSRKYKVFGSSAIGFAHGDEMKPAKLVRMMPFDLKDEWASIKHREYHGGHYHKRSKESFVSEDSYEGIVYRTLPSLTRTDAWHDFAGWAHGIKASDGYLWSDRNGLREIITVNASEAAA